MINSSQGALLRDVGQVSHSEFLNVYTAKDTAGEPTCEAELFLEQTQDRITAWNVTIISLLSFKQMWIQDMGKSYTF